MWRKIRKYHLISKYSRVQNTSSVKIQIYFLVLLCQRVEVMYAPEAGFNPFYLFVNCLAYTLKFFLRNNSSYRTDSKQKKVIRVCRLSINTFVNICEEEEKTQDKISFCIAIYSNAICTLQLKVGQMYQQFSYLSSLFHQSTLFQHRGCAVGRLIKIVNDTTFIVLT